MKHLCAAIFLLASLTHDAQLPKWILGSSQYTSNGNFQTLATGQLAFYEVDFTASLAVTPRIIGESIEQIASVGTQDVMNTAVSESGEVLFYAFAASTVPFQSSALPHPIKFILQLTTI